MQLLSSHTTQRTGFRDVFLLLPVPARWHHASCTAEHRLQYCLPLQQAYAPAPRFHRPYLASTTPYSSQYQLQHHRRSFSVRNTSIYGRVRSTRPVSLDTQQVNVGLSVPVPFIPSHFVCMVREPTTQIFPNQFICRDLYRSTRKEFALFPEVPHHPRTERVPQPVTLCVRMRVLELSRSLCLQPVIVVVARACQLLTHFRVACFNHTLCTIVRKGVIGCKTAFLR
jgi:hypothetical protein